jgi:hypothetical protein
VLDQPRALSYELTEANVADVLLVRELLAGACLDENAVARRLLGDLAYRGGALGEELAEAGVLLATEKADRRPPLRQQVEVCFAHLKRVLSSGWNVRWPRRSPGWPPGSRLRWPPTPTVATSTGCWVVLKDASKSCGPDILATLI